MIVAKLASTTCQEFTQAAASRAVVISKVHLEIRDNAIFKTELARANHW